MTLTCLGNLLVAPSFALKPFWGTALFWLWTVPLTTMLFVSNLLCRPLDLLTCLLCMLQRG